MSCGGALVWDFRVRLDSVIRTAEQLYKADTPEAVFEGFRQFAAKLGLPYVFMGRFGFMLETPHGPPKFLMTNLTEWKKIYIAKGYIHVDPIVHLAMRVNRAFFYDEAMQDMTKAQADLLVEAREHGVVDGFAIPVHRRVGSPGAVTVGSGEPLSLSSEQQLALELLGHVAFAAIERMMPADDDENRLRLTDRERTVLTLVARGKTNWEVGEILSISQYSVRDYLKSLARQLDTSNRTHTVARAIQLGLISP